MTVQTIIVQKFSENWVSDSLLLFSTESKVLSPTQKNKMTILDLFNITIPRLLQKGPAAGPSTKRSSLCGLKLCIARMFQQRYCSLCGGK